MQFNVYTVIAKFEKNSVTVNNVIMFNNCNIVMHRVVMTFSADVSEDARSYVPFFTFCQRLYIISRVFEAHSVIGCYYFPNSI